jgi:TIR domain/NHL repeat
MSDVRPPSHGPRDTWDVFVSYASQDRELVETIAGWLEDVGLRPFLDRWHLVLGGDSQEDLARGLSRSRCCAVFVGAEGLGRWQKEEVGEAIRTSVISGELRVIPVFLPGVPTSTKLPPFLANRNWCVLDRDRDGSLLGLEDLRQGVRDEPAGRRPDPAMPKWLTVVPGTGVLGEPTGVAVNGEDIFVADREGNRIVKISSSGTSAASGLNHPHHLIVEDEEVIVCDTYADRLAAFSLDLERTWERPRAGRRKLYRPHGLCWSHDHGLLAADTDKDRLSWVSTPRKCKPPSAVVSDCGWASPCGIASSPEGLFVADTFNHRIVVLDDDLHKVHEFGRRGYGDREFANPVGVACWHQYVVIADEHNQRLQLWKAVRRRRGGWTSKFITADMCRSQLGSPFGVTFDKNGVLYVTDRRRGRVLRIDFDAYLKAA